MQPLYIIVVVSHDNVSPPTASTAPAHFVPWSKPVEQLLRELQRKKLHMALVVDEYGGVMGLCTLEDVLEQIVGEIHDEFDVDDGRAVEAHADGSFTVLGATPIAEFNRA